MHFLLITNRPSQKLRGVFDSFDGVVQFALGEGFDTRDEAEIQQWKGDQELAVWYCQPGKERDIWVRA